MTGQFEGAAAVEYTAVTEEEFFKAAAERNVGNLDAGRTVRSGFAYDFDSTDVIPPSDAKRAARVKASLEGVTLAGLESRPVYRLLKRSFDIVFSAAVLICFSWLFLLIALLIKIDDPKGPVFFKQKRVGRLDADGNPTYFKHAQVQEHVR